MKKLINILSIICLSVLFTVPTNAEVIKLVSRVPVLNADGTPKTTVEDGKTYYYFIETWSNGVSITSGYDQIDTYTNEVDTITKKGYNNKGHMVNVGGGWLGRVMGMNHKQAKEYAKQERAEEIAKRQEHNAAVREKFEELREANAEHQAELDANHERTLQAHATVKDLKTAAIELYRSYAITDEEVQAINDPKFTEGVKMLNNRTDVSDGILKKYVPYIYPYGYTATNTADNYTIVIKEEEKASLFNEYDELLSEYADKIAATGKVINLKPLVAKAKSQETKDYIKGLISELEGK